MKKTLDLIIEECVAREIPVALRPNSQHKFSYEVSGFSKSCKAFLYSHKGKVICETKYGNLDEVENFHELAVVVLEWFLNYRNLLLTEEPEAHWAEYWVEKGIMEKVTKVSYLMK